MSKWKLTKAKIIEAFIDVVPYSSNMRNLDLDSEKEAIRFTWRGSEYRVSTSSTGLAHVEEVQGSFLAGSDIAILMEGLLNQGIIRLIEKEQRGRDELLTNEGEE